MNLAERLEKAGAPIIGTSPDSIARAEDRERFREVVEKLNLLQPANDVATSFEQAEVIAERIGYPVVVRPSFVLGGRAMEIVYDDDMLAGFLDRATQINPEHPVLIDRFLDDAIEIDVDALYDGHELYLGGVMEHIEEAGIHSGDSACALPPITLGRDVIDRIQSSTEAIARGDRAAVRERTAAGHGPTYGGGIWAPNGSFIVMAGAAGYILKASPSEKLVEAIGEGAVFVVDVEQIGLHEIVAHINIGPAILVNITNSDSQAESVPCYSGFARHIPEKQKIGEGIYSLIPVQPVGIGHRAVIFPLAKGILVGDCHRSSNKIHIKIPVAVIIKKHCLG